MDWTLFLTLCLQVPLATIVVAASIAVARGLLSGATPAATKGDEDE